MSRTSEIVVTIVSSIVGLAIISVLISRNSATPEVIRAAASGLGNLIGTATSPVTGNNPKLDLSYPGGSGLSFNLPSIGR